ncbi:histidine phosphatase family protein [Actinomadura sp. HBU206391]|uniref:histidine phosphatase family protein n=1 Tax=Actinomadura sp. HBU206391 TaxID=2731692 RepID=UPI002905DEB1|nr:histidine phosphatase family protein [Actinomadura sp. HBU206391]
MRVRLIRHGQSESNAGLPTNGPAVTPLTAVGREQAERVAEVFTEPPSLIVSSPFIRAGQTAEPTRRRFPDVPYEEWPVQEFTYLGSLHGPSTTGEERRPHVEAYWERCDPTYVNGGGGESFAALIGRTGDLLGRVDTGSEGLVAVFTHGLFMRALIWSVLTGTREPDAADMRDYRRFAEVYVLPNGCIVDLRLTGGRPAVVGGGVTHLPVHLVTGAG